MTLKQYLSTIAVGTLFAWIAWGLILLNINPNETSLIGIIVFYLTLFAGNAGLFTVIGTLVRNGRKKHDDLQAMILTSLRQAILLSLLLIAALFLLRLGLLTWWVMLIVLFVIILIEFFALSAAGRLPHD
jgi:Ca2+/Na+ antiporter